MEVLNRLIALATLFTTLGHAYYDAGHATVLTTPVYEPTIPHHLSPTDYELYTKPWPSMITAVAPSMAIMGNGISALEYSIHSQHDVVQHHQHGQDIFKRGVFASDPPLPTCQSCDRGGNPLTSTSISATNFSSTPCSTIPYSGVFRSPPPKSSFCFNTDYTGVFTSSTTRPYGLPCCSTIPSSCLAKSTVVPTLTFTSGVFVTSTIFVSNFTTSTFTQPRSTSPSISSLRSTSTSSLVRSSFTSGSGSVSPGLSSSRSFTSRSSSPSSTLSSVTSVVVISSTTIIISSSPQGSSSASTLNTITVITVTPSSTANPTFELGPNSITGCGTASGCGTVIGSGTVYIGPGGLLPVVSSGTASGCASTVIGCGTIIGTGAFSGTGVIIGCGEGSGYATMTGEGTVWPAALGGLVSFVSSGVVTGSGRVRGCGSITGTGTFSATSGFTVPQTPTPTRTTIEVYVSYCPTTIPGGGLPRLSSNFSSSPESVNNRFGALNTTLSFPSNTTDNNDDSDSKCRDCPNSAGICCPREASCDEFGKCPWIAMQGMGYIKHGFNVIAQRNLSDGSVVPWAEEMPFTGDVSENERLVGSGVERGRKEGGKWRGASRVLGTGNGEGAGRGKGGIGKGDEEGQEEGKMDLGVGEEMETRTGSVLRRREWELGIIGRGSVGGWVGVAGKGKRGKGEKSGYEYLSSMKKTAWGNGFVVGEDIDAR